RKGGARQISIDKVNELLQIDYQKNTKPGSKIVFDKVLSCEGEEFGQPYLKNVQVIGEVVEHQGKRKKIVIAKRKAKKRYKKKQGHRQAYTLIKIVDIAKLT
ncbi:5840_t:CDS:1, partial [Funneliformis geosporum]